MPLSVSFYVRVFLNRKNKNFHQEPVFMPFIFCISVRTFLAGIKMIFTTIRNRNEARKE